MQKENELSFQATDDKLIYQAVKSWRIDWLKK